MIKNDKDLFQIVMLSLEKAKDLSFDYIIDFVDDEYEELSRGEVINRIMLTIRPDPSEEAKAKRKFSSEFDRTIPDWCVENGCIDSIDIEKGISEETFNVRLIVRVYLNEKYHEYMNKNI